MIFGLILAVVTVIISASFIIKFILRKSLILRIHYFTFAFFILAFILSLIAILSFLTI